MYVHPHLEYAVVSWSPWTMEDKEVLERVQRRAVGMVSNLRGRTYGDRLVEVGMTSLEDRRVRGDMIATYKIMSGKDKVDLGMVFNLVAEGAGSSTRRAEGVRNIIPVRAKLYIRRQTGGTLSRTASRGPGLS